MTDPRDALTEDEQEIARLTIFGLPTAQTIRGVACKADWPLTLEQAAVFVGYRTKRARNYLDPLPEFNRFRRTLLDQRRKASKRVTSPPRSQSATRKGKTSPPIARLGSRPRRLSRGTRARPA